MYYCYLPGLLFDPPNAIVVTYTEYYDDYDQYYDLIYDQYYDPDPTTPHI